MRSVNMQRGRGEQGTALIIAMLLLVMMGMIGLAALETVSRDRQVAGFQSRKGLAFYAAEAGIAVARERIMNNGGEPTVTNTTLGDTQLFPYGQPSFGPDPSLDGDGIEDLGGTGGSSSAGEMNLADQGNGPLFQNHLWRIRVQGTAPGGATARIEVVAAGLDTTGG
jgi:hypothetical protein